MRENKFRKPIMWRKRYIPDELIDISSDEVLYRDNKLMVTRWKVIHPRSDFQSGISFVLLNEGIKISRFYDENKHLVKIYCDIIDVEYDSYNDEYTFIDLLLDVVISSENKVTILDIDELNEAIDKGLITKKQINLSRKRLKKLIDMIITNNFPPSQIKDKWEEYK